MFPASDEQIAAVLTNAESLLRSSKALADIGQHRHAAALSNIAIEECAKAMTLRHAHKYPNANRLIKGLKLHKAKHRTVANFFTSVVMNYRSPAAEDGEVDLVDARNTVMMLLTRTTDIDAIKQACLYVHGTLPTPLTASPEIGEAMVANSLALIAEHSYEAAALPSGHVPESVRDTAFESANDAGVDFVMFLRSLSA